MRQLFTFFIFDSIQKKNFFSSLLKKKLKICSTAHVGANFVMANLFLFLNFDKK
jgi:hypothetical protein